MSDAVIKSLEEIRRAMAEKFGKQACKIEMTVDEAIAVRLTVEQAITAPDVDNFIKQLLELAKMRIQRGLDDVK